MVTFLEAHARACATSASNYMPLSAIVTFLCSSPGTLAICIIITTPTVRGDGLTRNIGKLSANDRARRNPVGFLLCKGTVYGSRLQETGRLGGRGNSRLE